MNVHYIITAMLNYVVHSISFQAVFGAFLFSKFSWRGLTLIVLGCVTFLQSALQKLLKLTVIYGTEFWEAVDIYGVWIQNKMNYVIETSTTSVIITIYLLIYGVCGLLAGRFIKNVIKIIAQKKATDFYLESIPVSSEKLKSKTFSGSKIIWLWLITIAIIVLAFTFFGGSLIGWEKAIYIMLRSFLILLLWYLILGPLVLKIIHKYLSKKESQYQSDISRAMDLFPYFRQIIYSTWKETDHLKGYTRFKYFIAHSISNCIHFKTPL